jgi:hypothetical protein
MKRLRPLRRDSLRITPARTDPATGKVRLGGKSVILFFVLAFVTSGSAVDTRD